MGLEWPIFVIFFFIITLSHLSPVQKEFTESLEIRISPRYLRSELFRLDQVLHMSEDQAFLLRSGLYADGVQDEGLQAQVAWHDDCIIVYCEVSGYLW